VSIRQAAVPSARSDEDTKEDAAEATTSRCGLAEHALAVSPRATPEMTSHQALASFPPMLVLSPRTTPGKQHNETLRQIAAPAPSPPAVRKVGLTAAGTSDVYTPKPWPLMLVQGRPCHGGRQIEVRIESDDS
jgi:hypothetical protein